jgi:hypothetical protein
VNRDKRRDLFEAVGLLAVVASLVVLILEVRQNTNALFAQSRQSIMASSMQELILQFDNPNIALSIIKTEPLTMEEQIQLDAFLTSSLRAREFAWLQHKDAAIDDGQFETELEVIGVIFDSSRIRRWWNSLGRHYFSSQFVEFIDAELEGRQPTDTIWGDVTTWDFE